MKLAARSGLTRLVKGIFPAEVFTSTHLLNMHANSHVMLFFCFCVNCSKQKMKRVGLATSLSKLGRTLLFSVLNGFHMASTRTAPTVWEGMNCHTWLHITSTQLGHLTREGSSNSQQRPPQHITVNHPQHL